MTRRKAAAIIAADGASASGTTTSAEGAAAEGTATSAEGATAAASMPSRWSKIREVVLRADGPRLSTVAGSSLSLGRTLQRVRSQLLTMRDDAREQLVMRHDSAVRAVATPRMATMTPSSTLAARLSVIPHGSGA